VSHHRVARTLVYTHRWLGIALSLLFVVWFVSGLVMMYARMPELTPAERLAALAPINFGALKVEPGMVAQEASRFTITTFAGRPVYRVTSGGMARTIYADTGEELAAVDADRATEIARAFAGGVAGVRYEARLDDADQWTFGVRGQVPMHRIAVDDAEGTRLYVAERSGDVVMRTTASGRRWGYLVTGLLVLTGADILYALRLANDAYAIGTPLDAGWAIGLTLVAAWVDGSVLPDITSRGPHATIVMLGHRAADFIV